MGKKILPVVLILVAICLIIVGLVYFFGFRNNVAPVMSMAGHITEIKEGGVIIEGLIGEENKVVELIITPETIFENNVIKITESQAKSGEPFSPVTEIIPGRSSDLNIGMLIKIRTAGNLLKARKIKAVEINYRTYDFPF